MKTKIFYSLFLMIAVFFTACNDKPVVGEETKISLDKESITLYVGDTATLVATVTPENTPIVWSSNNEAAVTVDQDGVVTAVAVGSAFVIATADGQVANCVVAVKENVVNKEYPSLEGSEYYPIVMDAWAGEQVADKIVYDFRPDDVTKFCYIWDATYNAATTSGLNFYGNDGGYTGLVVSTLGWSGMGYLVDGAQVKDLWTKIQEAPEDYYIHMAMKSTDNYSHSFYFLGIESVGNKIGVGPKSVYDAPVKTDFTRDGEWHEMEFCFADLSIDGFTEAADGAGINVFVALTEGVSGATLNMDAVFIYKK